MADAQQNEATTPTHPSPGIIGSTGLKQYGGTIDEEFLTKLKGARAAKVYREMSDNSSAIGAVRYLIRTLVRQAEFRVEPADDSDKAREQAGFVEECMEDMSNTFDDFISEVLTFIEYGWAYFEILWKLRKGKTDDPTTRSKHSDGKWGLRKFMLIGHETLDRWEIDTDDGGIRGLRQWDPYTSKSNPFIPIEKAVLFRTETTKNNPEGRSLWRNAYTDYQYLKRISAVEAVGIERDMTGLLTMEVPIALMTTTPGTIQAQLRGDIERQLSQLKRDEREYALVPSELDTEGKPTGYKLKLLSTGGRRQIDTATTKKDYRFGILQSCLSQFLQLGMQAVGSFALASSQTNLFSQALGALLDIITETINRFVIPKLMEANKVPTELWPYMVHGDVETPPLDEIGKFLVSMTSAGFDLDEPAIKRKLLEIANLPQTDEHLPEGEINPGDKQQTQPEKKGAALTPQQMQAVAGVIGEVRDGKLPRESAIELILASMPVSKEQAEKIMGKVGRGFKPKPQDEAA